LGIFVKKRRGNELTVETGQDRTGQDRCLAGMLIVLIGVSCPRFRSMAKTERALLCVRLNADVSE
jgi:hypothetical protein